MNNLGRNEPCHCGSGKKYKHCHLKEDNTKINSNKSLLIGGSIILFVILAGLMIYIRSNQGSAPGPAPEGQVWSEEHGHFHNK